MLLQTPDRQVDPSGPPVATTAPTPAVATAFATDLVVGKVFARVWPASRFSLLDKPDAFDALD